MATIPQYITVMRNTAWDLCKRFGVDVQYEAKSDRAEMLAVLGVQAILIDLLVKKGVVTDAVLTLVAELGGSSRSSGTPHR